MQHSARIQHVCNAELSSHVCIGNRSKVALASLSSIVAHWIAWLRSTSKRASEASGGLLLAVFAPLLP